MLGGISSIYFLGKVSKSLIPKLHGKGERTTSGPCEEPARLRERRELRDATAFGARFGVRSRAGGLETLQADTRAQLPTSPKPGQT